MRYLVNSREMKQYDKNTSEHFKVPSIVLMEQAAQAFVSLLSEEASDTSETLIVCGVGNNGGDGLAIARLLSLSGSHVTVVRCGNPDKATEENLLQAEILLAYRIPILTEIPEKTGRPYTLIVDALFGVGLARAVEGEYKKLIQKMNELPGKKAAVDIPSGISADNGAVLGAAFRADFTVTFAYEKRGLYLFPGCEYCSRVRIGEIGIREESFLGETPGMCLLEEADVPKLLPQRTKRSNKGTYGKLLVIAGSPGMAGAAILSAKAAYASGCGLVCILTPEENRIVIQTALPEAILATYNEKTLKKVLEEKLAWADVILCGPGIGTDKAAEKLVHHVLKDGAVPVVLDADALNLISKDTDILQTVHTPWMVTPHLGEMSRLTGKSVPEIQKTLVETAAEFAQKYGGICVLKDAHTVTALPQKGTLLNLSGNNGMATAGSGDVLGGIIAGLMAQGLSADTAAPLGVFLHGRAGDIAAEHTGSYGLMASDLIDGMRELFAGLLEKEG